MNIKYKDNTNYVCPRCGKDDFDPGGGCAICIDCESISSNQYMEISAVEKMEKKEE